MGLHCEGPEGPRPTPMPVYLIKKGESVKSVFCIFEEKITVFIFLDGGVDKGGAKAEAKVTNVLLDKVEMLFAVVEFLLKIRCEGEENE